MARRTYANRAEQLFNQLALRNGWSTTKRGWPDFLCFGPQQEVIAVEVKPRLTDGRLKSLKEPQAKTLDFLSSVGVKCYVSDGETLEPYQRSKHRRPRY